MRKKAGSEPPNTSPGQLSPIARNPGQLSYLNQRKGKNDR